jgi:uncharacterized membrane protein
MRWEGRAEDYEDRRTMPFLPRKLSSESKNDGEGKSTQQTRPVSSSHNRYCISQPISSAYKIQKTHIKKPKSKKRPIKPTRINNKRDTSRTSLQTFHHPQG